MAALSGTFWLILVTHIFWFAILGAEIKLYWGMRKKLKIHARSPMLAVISGIAGFYMQILIMLFQLFAEMGIALPCVIMLYSNSVFMVLYPLPYLLRGLRVVIVSDKVWRGKYSFVLSRNNVFLMLFVACTTLLLASIILQFVSRDLYGPNPTKACVALSDYWFFGPIAVTCAGGSSKLFIELARVKDKIGMSREVFTAALIWGILIPPYYGMFIANDMGRLTTPLSWNFVLTVCIQFTQLSTFFIEPRMSKGKIHICPHSKKKIVVIVDEAHITVWKETWHNSRVIMACPPLDHAFEQHVQDYLCSESYDFLKALDAYVESAETVEPEALFVTFRAIIMMYIMPGSELEVNIETAMRNKILKIGDIDKFLAADADTRRDIFNPSGTEIRKMLDENLLKTFLVSTMFLNTCKKLDEENDAEKSNSTSILVEGDLLVPFEKVGP